MRVERKNVEFKNIEFDHFTVSNETILGTKQEFFFTKVTLGQSITEIVLLGISLIMLPRMFISYYTIRSGDIGLRYHPERDKFSLLFLGWYIIRKFETLR